LLIILHKQGVTAQPSPKQTLNIA